LIEEEDAAAKALLHHSFHHPERWYSGTGNGFVLGLFTWTTSQPCFSQALEN
jgi:hypothetical protein